MTVQAAIPRYRRWRGSRGLWLAIAIVVVLMAAAGTFVSYILWPTWPKSGMALDAPAIPVTVAGALFNVPPAAIRAAVQRHPGAHERIDLVFLWPSLAPPTADGQAGAKTSIPDDGDAAPVRTDDRVFATIAGLGAGLPPMVRLRTIYPRYIEAQAAAGPDGLAIVPFRAGTPYEGEDLVCVGTTPEQFFARCTRQVGTVRGTCLYERLVATAEGTLPFPRTWLEDWRGVAAGADRLVAQLHPQKN